MEKPDNEQIHAEIQRRIETAVLALDYAIKAADGNRRVLFGAIGATIDDVMRGIAQIAFEDGDPKHLDLNVQSTVCGLYIAAILAMCADANTQWDEMDLLSDQFRHHLRRVGGTIDVHSARVVASATQSKT